MTITTHHSRELRAHNCKVNQVHQALIMHQFLAGQIGLGIHQDGWWILYRRDTDFSFFLCNLTFFNGDCTIANLFFFVGRKMSRGV